MNHFIKSRILRCNQTKRIRTKSTTRTFSASGGVIIFITMMILCEKCTCLPKPITRYWRWWWWWWWRWWWWWLWWQWRWWRWWWWVWKYCNIDFRLGAPRLARREGRVRSCLRSNPSFPLFFSLVELDLQTEEKAPPDFLFLPLSPFSVFKVGRSSSTESYLYNAWFSGNFLVLSGYSYQKSQYL